MSGNALSRRRLRRRRAWLASAALACLVPAPPLWAAQIEIAPLRDTTLIESATGALGNGAGPGLWIGRTNQPSGSRRRAVLAFDLGQQPELEQAVIMGVTLRLVRESGAAMPAQLDVHALSAAWGEGASSHDGGQGAPAEPDDATWLHAFHDTTLWATPGGDIDATPSATGFSVTGDILTWSSPGLLADVAGWLADPATNHGWLLRGDESISGTVLRVASRESVTEDARPVLVVDYAPAVPALGASATAGLALVLLAFGVTAVRRRGLVRIATRTGGSYGSGPHRASHHSRRCARVAWSRPSPAEFEWRRRPFRYARGPRLDSVECEQGPGRPASGERGRSVIATHAEGAARDAVGACRASRADG